MTARRLPAGMTVVDLPGLPAGVEVRASTRRRRTVTAFREHGTTIVLVPARMSGREIAAYVRELVGRLAARDVRGARSDDELAARAAALSARHLQGRAAPSSVRWVTNQRQRWGSCTPLDGSIRISDRLRTVPTYVLDYVLVHELAHLLVAGHGPDFRALEARHPRAAEAQAFLAGYDHAAQADGPGVDPDAGAAAPHGVGDPDRAVDLTDPTGVTPRTAPRPGRAVARRGPAGSPDQLSWEW